MSFLLAFLAFVILIVLHELGHFVAAKMTGMRVERFFLFFPPLKLFSRSSGAKPSTAWVPCPSAAS